MEQSEETILGLRFLMIGMPVILIALSGLIYQAYYRLNGAYQDMVVESITQPSEAY